MEVPEIVKRLSRLRFTSAQAAAGAGMPATRLAVRIKEGRVPRFASYLVSPSDVGAARRTFGLSEVYVLRLVEALTIGAGIDVSEAIAAIDDLRGINLVPLVSAPGGIAATFEHRLDAWPGEWPAAWRGRDLAQPAYMVAARVPVLGWRTYVAGPDVAIGDALRALGGAPENTMAPLGHHGAEFAETATLAPLGAVIINLTRELVAVDAALARFADKKRNEEG